MALYSFDGTWNDGDAEKVPAGTERHTNVYLFKERYADGDVFYANGPGTRRGFIGKVLGGFSGLGASSRVSEAFEFLTAAFQRGDTTIDVIGYSRGAAIARMFVETVRENYHLLAIKGASLSSPPDIRFLGLFDTVGSFGLPWTSDEGEFTPRIPSFVKNTCHAMALDETRETFGIERCIGDRATITEVWFRGGHGDIGGNAVVKHRDGYETNRHRSDIALRWISRKAIACGLVLTQQKSEQVSANAPVTASEMAVEIGRTGSLSRRIHLGDLVQYTVEQSDITDGIDGRMLRRIDVPTRIEDEHLENTAAVVHWVPVEGSEVVSETGPVDSRFTNPRLIELSSRRYPFDIQPARTWRAWMQRWNIDQFDDWAADAFWAPCEADRALAWDVLVELATRVATLTLADDEGDDIAALTSIHKLFPEFRCYLHRHGPQASNAAALINAYLNLHVRPFTTSWHRRKESGDLDGSDAAVHREFRDALRSLQPRLVKLRGVLSELADASLDGSAGQV